MRQKARDNELLLLPSAPAETEEGGTRRRKRDRRDYIEKRMREQEGECEQWPDKKRNPRRRGLDRARSEASVASCVQDEESGLGENR